MRKYKSIFALALVLFLILPYISVSAGEPVTKEQKKAYTAQLRQKQTIIRKKTLNIKSIQSQLRSMSNDAAKALESLFNTEAAPTKEFADNLQTKQKQLLQNLIMIGKLESAIKIEKLQAKTNINKGNYSKALVNFENTIDLLDREEVFLNAYTKDLKQYVELMKSLKCR